MDYKEVINEQIKKLQGKQNEQSGLVGCARLGDMCLCAKTIAELAEIASHLPNNFISEDGNGVCKDKTPHKGGNNNG